ncbi:BAG-associated GRAM protein 1-like [Gossypium hirsutum]|uniref:BAG-associated GRAM protein 1-like n=1 Tax=Gossypium hirsutum TaxID=3635 RepID=A0A1U8N7G2_GOSHI|nr:BAG-associated GRAM protein 1-like [Gossypium hirsutum]XP_016718251.1 BAG-associated GRAM protein 1-like [Gossypium hirsutum]XP_016733803.1 BAG-associated GRAM protein 1-like [Gossypium hirsutum]XP_040939777.1 BAG-associated GRAM protein 1-like [Gossypium hirsutum]XP_040944149.1 BAG-associated GRAM protein 1-like [Gossypium hirsutum]XP_040955206.1 BAG-associated GRAM protein 1-like [Gossypium hirsutum]XP_040959948.1 BAG-associated GRAM protein 1-like [Gossypium hirsutum]XP_040959949.1 BAG
MWSLAQSELLLFVIISKAFRLISHLSSTIFIGFANWRAFTNRGMNGYAGANTRRRISSDKQGPTVVHQKPGPLQTIFKLLPDEVVEHSYSCALERSFLYHGRMYVSAWHICFHSNVFSKQMKVVIPFGDIDEIRRSQHAFINPAITIILRMGAGGHGVPCNNNYFGTGTMH